MSRREEFQNQNPNPAQKWLEWKSEKKCFEYYDKEASKKVEVKLPFKFLTLKEMHVVKGWEDNSQSGITSNEVSYIGTQPLKVRSFKGGEIAEGLYRDIKLRVKDHGGYYVKSIYVMTEEGEIWNVQLKGSAVQEWGEFTKKSKSRLPDEWVVVEGADERKKGATKYHVPVFKYATSLSKDEDSKAEKVYATLKMYMDNYQAIKEPETVLESAVSSYDQQQPPIESYSQEHPDPVDDLPF